MYLLIGAIARYFVCVVLGVISIARLLGLVQKHSNNYNVVFVVFTQFEKRVTARKAVTSKDINMFVTFILVHTVILLCRAKNRINTHAITWNGERRTH